MRSLAPVVRRAPAPPAPRRLLAAAVLTAALAWAVAQGAHTHGGPAPIEADLAGAEARTIRVDASTGTLDLRGVAVAPGEVVEFVLEGSAEAGHRFVLTGLAGAEIDRRTAPDGDAVVRVRAPLEGALTFFCTVPGHEGLHGSLVVGGG